MISDFFERQFVRQRREFLIILLPALFLAAAALWLAYQFVEPAPPRTVIMSTGSPLGAYHAYGQKYATILARAGVKLELMPSNGSRQNVARLIDASTHVKVALVQGGTVVGAESAGLVSLGRVYQEPLWIFHRSDQPKTRLTDLAGQRLSIGPEGSGTRPLVLALLEANGMTAANSQLFGFDTADSVVKLLAGDVDAIFLVSGAGSPTIKQLMSAPGIRLLSLEQGEAYTRLFPHLGLVTLPEGLINLSENIPARDVAMLAPQASLLAREDLHPAIVGLLVDAAKEVHAPGGLFERPGEYPKPLDPGLVMSDDAKRVYASGKNFLHRQLPFWVATFIERMLVMVVPLATILLPLLKIVPWLYQWRIRNRIYYWYAQLKRLERELAQDRSVGAKLTYRDRLIRIEDAVSVIPVPIRYSDQLYMLRAAILVVRQRIAG